MTRFAHSFFILTFAMFGANLSAFAQVNEAGKVLLSLGDVKVLRSAKEMPLKKGDSIQSGDVIVTGATSNVQLRMTDGAVIAIRAQTEFKINEYKFNGKEDGTERASLSLAKGGVRAVTGVIGRTNRDNLQVDGVVATVGVRGTGFNIVYCQGNCVNSDRSPAKNGLYANVFEGKVVVKNEATSGTYGVNEPVLIESKNSAISRLREIPVFMKDPLAGQVVVPKKAESVVVPVAAAVVVPKESAQNIAPANPSLAVVSGVVIAVPPSLTSSPIPLVPQTYFNKPGLGQGSPVAQAATGYFLQVAETYPGSVGAGDGLPYHNILPANNAKNLAGVLTNPGAWGVTESVGGTSTSGYPSKFELPATVAGYLPSGPSGVSVNDAYALGGGSQVEGGTYNGIVSWGRWSGTVAQVGGYNNGSPISYGSNSGFAYIIGSLTPTSDLTNLFTARSTLNFNLIGGTSPVSVAGQAGTSWFVTSGNLTANFASAAISGNLGLVTNQTAGYGAYNMNFSGPLGTGASNPVSTTLVKSSGTLATCSTACSGSGNVSFYGAGAAAAGLSYNVNTGRDVIQGVATFKR